VAQQIAAALSGRYALHTVHIIAHAAPGRVGFAAGHLDLDVLMAHPAWRNDRSAAHASDLAVRRTVRVDRR
jgi:hypothetical protein